MAIVAEVKNGQLVDNNSSTTKNTGTISSAKGEAKTSTSTVNEDTFMTLLVAEMQYQDPLEPTSNTEYISELSSFTQVQSIQGMQSSLSDMSAQSLVGKYVTLTDEDGKTVTGMVDFTKTDDGVQYVSVNDKTYKASTITQVFDAGYYEAQTMASTFNSMMSALPSADKLTTDSSQALKNARTLYNSLTSYQKQFIQSTDLTKLTDLEAKMAAITPKTTDSSSQTSTDTSGSSSQTSTTTA